MHLSVYPGSVNTVYCNYKFQQDEQRGEFWQDWHHRESLQPIAVSQLLGITINIIYIHCVYANIELFYTYIQQILTITTLKRELHIPEQLRGFYR